MDFDAFLAHAQPYRRQLALVAVLSLCGSLISLAIPWLAAQLLGGIMGAVATKIGLIVTLLISALFALTTVTIASSLISSIVSARILAKFRNEVYEHVQSLPLTFHDQSRQGDLLSLLSSDVARLSGFISSALSSSLSAIITAGGAIVILFWLDPLLALLVPLLVPGFYIGLRVIGRRLRTLAANVREAEMQVMSTAEQNLQMLPAIKAFAREDTQAASYAANVETARALSVRQARIFAFLGPVIQLIAASAVITIIFLASRNLASGTMNATELFSSLLYAALLTRPVGNLANLYGEFNGAKGSLERLQDVLQEKPEPGYQAKGKVGACAGAISIQDVSFSYQDRSETLSDLCLEIKAGEIVALTGTNGAGKTTIVRLLMGLYLPQSGRITLDGVDIVDLNVQDLRRQVGYVPQRPLLFNGTVRENITFGIEGVDHGQIEQAARLSQALDFIKKLPQGLETVIGDHGVRLSGGQRQRIALARALLQNPQILILDEATSMYDYGAEAEFVEACRSALIGRTVILITHRPASLALANRVLTISDGRILEDREGSGISDDLGMKAS